MAKRFDHNLVHRVALRVPARCRHRFLSADQDRRGPHPGYPSYPIIDPKSANSNPPSPSRKPAHSRILTANPLIDVLFASAGRGEAAPLGEITEQRFDAAFGLNARGTLFTVHKALPLFNEGESIIMIGSVA